MRLVTQEDIEYLDQALWRMQHCGLCVHDAMLDLIESSSGIHPVESVYNQWHEEVEELWEQGVEVNNATPCVKKFIHDFGHAIDVVRGFETPF